MKLYEVPGYGVGLLHDGSWFFVAYGVGRAGQCTHVWFEGMDRDVCVVNHMAARWGSLIPTACMREKEEVHRFWEMSSEDVLKLEPEIRRRLKEHESST